MDSFGNYPSERPFDPFSVMLFKGLQVVAFLFFIALLAMNPEYAENQDLVEAGLQMVIPCTLIAAAEDRC